MSAYQRIKPPAQMPPVILHLLLVNVLVYFAMRTPQVQQYYEILAGHYVFDPMFRPWQIITHMFMHSIDSPFHLFSNMFGLWMFGRILTGVWDNQRFLFFYFTCGLGAFIAHQLYLYFQLGTSVPSGSTTFLGASGAVYGILVAFATLFPNSKVMLLIPPIPMKAKYMILLLIVLDLFGGVFGNLPGAFANIAHFAHLGGALTGFLLVKYWQKNSTRFY